MEKSFIQFSRSNYSEKLRDIMDKDFIDDLIISVEDTKDYSEFIIEWKKINHDIFCQIKMFDDSWKIFKKLPELFEKISTMSDTNPKVSDIIKLLKELGFKDKTKK